MHCNKTIYFQVLKFPSEKIRDSFLQSFEQFIQKVGVTRQRINMALHPALRQAVTRKDRQKRLEMFFRVVFSQVGLKIYTRLLRHESGNIYSDFKDKNILALFSSNTKKKILELSFTLQGQKPWFYLIPTGNILGTTTLSTRYSSTSIPF